MKDSVKGFNFLCHVIHYKQKRQKERVLTLRRRRDSNPRGTSPIAFEAIRLTTLALLRLLRKNRNKVVLAKRHT